MWGGGGGGGGVWVGGCGVGGVINYDGRPNQPTNMIPPMKSCMRYFLSLLPLIVSPEFHHKVESKAFLCLEDCFRGSGQNSYVPTIISIIN